MFLLKEIETCFFEMQDLEYKEFHCRLMPNIEKQRVIGIRIPELRKFSRKIYGTVLAEVFLKELPHKYYEENNLHAFLTEQIKDYDKCIARLEKFLPFVDNWATCDMLRPKVFAKNKDKLIVKIREWIKSEHTYTIRFGIEMLMVHFLESDFKPEYLNLVAEVKNEEYYVMMMKAWYFATALAKQYDSALPYLEEKRLDKTTHNKTISKALESYRITEVQKKYLKTLKY